LFAAGVNTLRLSATRVNTLRLSAAGRAGIAVSARVVAVPLSPPASTPLALALAAVGLTFGLVLPISSAGKGTLSFTGGEAVDDADE
jgi:hypothetical protein